MMDEKPARVSGLPCQENRACLADRVRHRKGWEALTIETSAFISRQLDEELEPMGQTQLES